MIVCPVDREELVSDRSEEIGKIPPPIPCGSDPKAKLWRIPRKKVFKRVVFACILFTMGLFVLSSARTLGLVRPFGIPSRGMAPALIPGDKVMVERFTFLFRKPRRGDLVVFKTDNIFSLPAGEYYVKRVVGEPGDRVRIVDGQLFINGRTVILSNAIGKINYVPADPRWNPEPDREFSVTDGAYFVLGDNSTNSLDSRYWGSVSGNAIIGRVGFRYFPPSRIGTVK